SKACLEAGLKEGDVPLRVMGTEVSMETARQIFGRIHSMNVGDIVETVVQRGEEEVIVNVPLQQKMDRHIFSEMENLSPEQKSLREAWSTNL
ncbi:MAG: hypothetical protein H6Q27_1299, partial [Ignavibacteriaceae bacterium]|nr:hypothetical protein [Ignavibacteriaceae bacterium]